MRSACLPLPPAVAYLLFVRPNKNMVKDVSKSRGSERDLFRGWTSSLLLWGLPWFAFVLGYSLSPAWRTVLWTTSLAFMGVACLLNAFRCGPNSLPVHGTVFHPRRYLFPRIRAWASSIWTVRMEMDWRRDNHWRYRVLLHSGTCSWPLSSQ